MLRRTGRNFKKKHLKVNGTNQFIHRSYKINKKDYLNNFVNAIYKQREVMFKIYKL